jgi:hypothetical protein
MKKITAILLGAAIGAGFMFANVASITAEPTKALHTPVERPWCPQEDSCTPTYDGTTNSWTIRVDAR